MELYWWQECSKFLTQKSASFSKKYLEFQKMLRGISERKLYRKFSWAVTTKKYLKIGTYVWRKKEKIPILGPFLANFIVIKSELIGISIRGKRGPPRIVCIHS